MFTNTFHANYVDTLIAARRGKRPPTMGKSLDKMTRAMGTRMSIEFTEGVRRPQNSEQAAKLASEAGVHIRNSMPILTHWKDYKNNSEHFENFMGKLSVSNSIFHTNMFPLI